MLKIGLNFDLRNPPGWRVDDTRLYAFALELCEEAERLGADAVWCTEHHLSEDGYLPQPLTFLSAVAARTRKVRLGTAILLAPLRHPATLAEEAALVDIISGGRLELGIGAGYRQREFDLFGLDYASRFKALAKLPAELRRLWAEGKVLPKPVQRPIPIWMGYQNENGARRAGLMGERLLSPRAELWPIYRQGLIDGGHDAHDPAIAQMGGLLQGWISDDPEADWPVVSKHLAYQVQSYRAYAAEGKPAAAQPPIDVEALRRASGPGGQLGQFMLATPAEAAQHIRAKLAGAPVTNVYFWASIANLPEKMVVKQMQTIFTKLAPLLKAA
jgi:alkanesulfonate monooxygenase SsuD/methylene tetrahydromethanopterin reductase-like flavin-dependent oxidoreductase (luciferase family)